MVQDIYNPDEAATALCDPRIKLTARDRAHLWGARRKVIATGERKTPEGYYWARKFREASIHGLRHYSRKFRTQIKRTSSLVTRGKSASTRKAAEDYLSRLNGIIETLTRECHARGIV